MGYQQEAEKIEKDICELVYHMKGSITWEEAWNMSLENRNKMIEVVNKIKKEQAKKGGGFPDM